MQPLTIRWPGGEHDFKLGLSELEVIQQKTDCGPEHVLQRLSNGTWHAHDLVEVIRNGLIGGGMAPNDALREVRKAFDLHPLIGFKAPALSILYACLFGPPDDPVGEDQGEPPQAQKTASGNSAPTTASARRSGSRRKKSG